MRVEETIQREILEQRIDMELEALTKRLFGCTVEEATDRQVYVALLYLVKGLTDATVPNDGDKKVYYISAEFLIGKLLSNNLINLGIYEKLEEILKSKGKELSSIEEAEAEPSLGNGGLGRLAACFLDSIATLGLPGEGIGLNYHFGLFRQVFKDRLQTAQKDSWMGPDSWLNKTDVTFNVFFGDKKVTSRLYDIDVIGYDSGVNKLRLFDLEGVDESLVKDGISFDKDAVEKNLTLFLYPDDSDEAGKLLRIYQQYFMVSNAAQLILKEMKEKQYDLRRMYDHAVIQINDTHPSLIIPELIRIMVNDKAFTMDEAIEVVSRTCAYTNHTILAEALEKWPLEWLEKAVPQLVPIIRELADRVAKKYEDPNVQIIDENNLVHMARMDIHYGFSVNGVAAIHTEILKNTELHPFYKIYPEKFNNKTNGISHRRFLAEANPSYTKLINEAIGTGWLDDAAELEKLKDFADDPAFLERVGEAKRANKVRLAKYVKRECGLDIDPNSIFDVQVKRFHAYKRQLLNIFKVMDIYNRRLADPTFRVAPTTFIFSGKAASSYAFAKETIRLINSVADVINNDPRVNEVMKVCFIPNFRVSNAQLIYPAAEISEQISTAGMEASGTSNMKLMMNGALTLGTMDGANIEIVNLAGIENEKIFGLTAPEVDELRASHMHFAWDMYNSDRDRLGRVIDELTDNTFAHLSGDFESIHNELMSGNDHDFVMKDFRSYVDAWEELTASYADRKSWNRRALMNTASSGWFSSDRTIREYRDEIWHA